MEQLPEGDSIDTSVSISGSIDRIDLARLLKSRDYNHKSRLNPLCYVSYESIKLSCFRRP